MLARPERDDNHQVKYIVSDYEPRIFIVWKDSEFWATSTLEAEYSYIVLPPPNQIGRW